MTEDNNDATHRFLPRIRQELDKLPLTEDEKEKFIEPLLKNAAFLDTRGGKGRPGGLSEESTLFDFDSRIRAVVSAFEDDGLTYSKYLHALARMPQLLNYSPDKIISNINGMVDGLAEEGLTRRAYLKAASTNHKLFQSPPGRVSEHMRDTAARFADEGLTTRAYVKATLHGPSLFVMSPATVERNIRESAERLGIPVTSYLKAALKNPTLFWTPPEVAGRNVRGVVDLFTADGLTMDDYLKTIPRQPANIGQSPESLADNIIGVVERFEADGLTMSNYLKAALKQPSLFATRPETVAAHITGVVERFEADGMTTRAYLKAALQHPALFTQKAETVARHIDAVMDFAERGIFRPPAPRRNGRRVERSQESMRANAIDFLLKQPALMSLADDNYALREVHQRMTDGPTGPQFLQRARYSVEHGLMGYLGHDAPVDPVPNGSFVAGQANPTEEQAKRLVLRALMHSGLIKGGSMER